MESGNVKAHEFPSRELLISSEALEVLSSQGCSKMESSKSLNDAKFIRRRWDGLDGWGFNRRV